MFVIMGTRHPDREPWNNLGYLADNGYELAVRCPGCDRRTRIPVIPLAKRYGYYKHVDAVACRLRCQRCHQKGAEVRRVKWSDGIATGWRPGER
jgi:hypothetical protein